MLPIGPPTYSGQLTLKSGERRIPVCDTKLLGTEDLEGPTAVQIIKGTGDNEVFLNQIFEIRRFEDDRKTVIFYASVTKWK